MKEFIPGICWKSFCGKNILHANNLNDMGFKALRIYINLADFPQATPSQNYIVNIMNMQDGMWCWDDYSRNWWSSNINEKVKDAFDFCKKYNWLPIVCFGHNEEQSSWITRSPAADKWLWLKQMTSEFAKYLYNIYGFKRADIEIWNEPNECMSSATYIVVAWNMITGWKINANYKAHIFASNIAQQGYLDTLLADTNLMKVTDYISPHCISFDEWDSNLIDVTYNKVTAKGKKVSLLEISPLGGMNRMNKIIGKCDMYALVLIIRNSLMGTAMDIDDFIVYDFNNPNNFIAVTTAKMNWIKIFNQTYYKPYILESEDMELNYVKLGTVNEETRTVQEILKDSGYMITPLVAGKCDTPTVEAIKEFQNDYNLKVDGWVGSKTWDKLLWECATGAQRFAQLMTRKASYK